MFATSALKPKQRVRLLSFGKVSSEYRRRLLAMGLHVGIEGTLLYTAPMGCPLYFQMGDLHVVLRKNESKTFCWECV